MVWRSVFLVRLLSYQTGKDSLTISVMLIFSLRFLVYPPIPDCMPSEISIANILGVETRTSHEISRDVIVCLFTCVFSFWSVLGSLPQNRSMYAFGGCTNTFKIVALDVAQVSLVKLTPHHCNPLMMPTLPTMNGTYPLSQPTYQQATVTVSPSSNSSLASTTSQLSLQTELFSIIPIVLATLSLLVAYLHFSRHRDWLTMSAEGFFGKLTVDC